MVAPGKRSSPLSVRGDDSVTIFTNDDVQTRAIPHGYLASDSQTHGVSIARTTEQSPQSSGVFTYFISVDVRLRESRITTTTVRIDTIDARSARSACVHAAIVNISALMDGGNSHWLRSVFHVVLFLSSNNLHHKQHASCALSPWTDTCSVTMKKI